MPSRRALLIGNSDYKNPEQFKKLNAPSNDVHDLAEILKSHGSFEIYDILVNGDVQKIRRRIDDMFSEMKRGDLALLYYSGHGVKDKNGDLYLAAENSLNERLLSTGIKETYIHDAMRMSRCRHRILILDCCFSGKILANNKSSIEPLIFTELKGEASAILASSSTIQPSFEENSRNSLFTKYLIKGIKYGNRIADKSGNIYIDRLFEYIEQKVREKRPEQTPMIEMSSRLDKLIIAQTQKGKRIEDMAQYFSNTLEINKRGFEKLFLPNDD